MPEDVKFSISLPDGRQTEWDQKQYNKGAEKLFEKYPEAQVTRTSLYSGDDGLSQDSSFHIKLEDGRETDWDFDQFSKGRESLMEKYPTAEIRITEDITARRNRDFARQYEFAQSKVDDGNLSDDEKRQYVDFVGQNADRYDKVKERYGGQTSGIVEGAGRLSEIYSKMEALEEELKGLPEEPEYRGLTREQAIQYVAETNTPEGKRRREINAELEQLRKERENNPVWREYWAKTSRDLEKDVANSADAEKTWKKDKDYGIEAEYYNLANRFYKDALKTANAPSKYDETDGLANFFRGAGQNAMSALSIVELAKSLDNLYLLDTAKEIQKTLGKDANIMDFVNNRPEELDFLSDGQREMLKAFVRKAEIESARSDNMSVMYNAGKSAIQSAGFMADFLLTGGTGDAAAEAVARRIAGTTSKEIAAKGLTSAAKKMAVGTLEGVTKALVMTPMMPSSYSSFINNLAVLNEDGEFDMSAKAVLNSLGDVLVENFSENAGELFGIPFEHRFFDKIASTKLGEVGKAMSRTGAGQLMKQAGWHGMVGEMAEEVLGNAIRSMSGIDKDALSNFFQKDEFLTTLASFAPMSLIGGVSQGVQLYKTSRMVKDSGAELSRILSSLNYSKEAIDDVLDVSEQNTPEELGSRMSGLARQAIAAGGDVAEVEKAFGDYTIATSRQKFLRGVLEDERDQQRAKEIADIDMSVGSGVWRSADAEGNPTVRTITDTDGKVNYVLSQDEQGFFVVDQIGNTSFIDNSVLEAGNAVDSGEQSLNDYLDKRAEEVRSADEAARMEQERNDQVAALQRQVAANPAINIGTEEAPVIATVQSAGRFGVTAAWTDSDGNQTGGSFSWDEVGNYLGTPITVKTDDEIEEEEVAASSDIRGRKDDYNSTIPEGTEFEAILYEGDMPVQYKFRRAFIGEDGNMMLQVTDMETGEDTQITEEQALQGNLTTVLDSLKNPVAAEAETEEEASETVGADGKPRDFRGNEIPLKDDGTVNQTAFWNADPEAWARWNDGQRQDGGANSRGYIAKAVKKLQSDAKSIQKQIDKELDFDRIEQLESQLGQVNSRIAELERIEGNYVAEEAAAKAAEEKAAKEAKRAESNREQSLNEPQTLEEAVPQTPEQVLGEIFADIDSRLREAKTPEEREALMQEKRKALEDYYAITTTDPTIVGTRADILQRMEEAGCSEYAIQAVRLQLSVPGVNTEGFRAKGMVFIVADDIRDEKRARLAHYHEHWHNVTRAKGYARQLVDGIKAGVDYLLKTANKMAGVEATNGYGDYLGYPDPEEALADEVISLSMEIIADSTPENVDENLRKAGLDNQEIINFVKTIHDGERRNGQEVSPAGRGSTNAGDNAQAGQREDGRDSGAQPEGDVVSAGYRLGDAGDQGTGGGRQEEVGPFGRIFRQFVGKAKEAIQALIQNQGGEAIAALSHPEIGPIDLVWGEEGTNRSDGFGLAKLIKYHPEVVENLQEILNDMSIVSRSDNRINLQSERYKAAVRLTWDDQRKTWLLTAFEKKNSALDNTTDTGETLSGERNDTATPQDTVSDNKDSENPGETSVSAEKNEPISSITDAAQQDEDGIRLSIRTEKDVQRKIRKFAKSEEGRNLGWTDAKIESIISETADLIRAIHASVSGDKYYDEWAKKNPTVKVDWRDGVEKPTVTWSRANIEYKYDMSADLLCINNEGLENVLASPTMVDLMLRMNEATDEGFTSDDYLRLYETLRDMGFVVPCKGCFDAAMRLKMLPSVSRKFADLVNKTIDERNKDPEKFDAALRRKAGRDATMNGLPTSAANKEDAIRIGVAGDNLTEHVSFTQLMSAEGQTKALTDWGGIFRAWQRTGAGRPKDKLLPEPWTGDIVSTTTTIIGKYGEKTPSYRDILVNQGTGLRRNSHSEFRPLLAIDEIQFMREAFIRNLTVFKYMKELDDVRLFGQLGVKFNMSFFPAFVEGAPVAGLDANGDYIAAEESVGGREFEYTGEDGKTHYDGMRGFEEARKYVNKDVSLSSVIFSVPHLIKALTDVPTARDKSGIWGSLIPFHASGATARSLEAQGLGKARAIGVGHGFEEAFTDYDKGVTNFEAVQNERFGEGWEIIDGKKAGTSVEPGHKLEFANGTHYYNKSLGVHLFSSFYIYDSELRPEHYGKDGKVDARKAREAGHAFEMDYNDKVREIGTDTAYKDAADFKIKMLKDLGLLPGFDFDVPEDVFLRMCSDAKVDPAHPKLGWRGPGNSWNPIDSEAWYALECDYGMTDPATGKWAPHNPVGMLDENGERVFKLPDNAIDIIKDGVARYGERKDREEAKELDAIEEFARRSVSAGKLSQEVADEVIGNAREEQARQERQLRARKEVMDFLEGKTNQIDAANTRQKQPGSVVGETVTEADVEEVAMFRLSRNNKATVESWIGKREDLSDGQRKEVVDYIDNLNDAKTQLATARWFANGTIRIPEDMRKVRQAVSVAGKAKVDPLKYASPMELLDSHAEFKPSEERINPDDVPTLHKAAEYPDSGITVYDVDDTEESRKNMREIINTHFGADASPWCLLQGDGKGNLTKDSKKYWRHYNAYPKQVAFRDGKLLAFSANDTGIKVWWDRQDKSHYGIPVTKKIEGDELGRSASYILSDNPDTTDTPGVLSREPGSHLFKGNRQNGLYEEWSSDGSQILERTHYKDGKEDGVSEEWYPNGQLAKRSEMKDDHFAGVTEYWFDNGNPKIYVELDEDGNKDGVQRNWYKSGQLSVESRWEQGHPVGDYTRWHEDGTLEQILHYGNDGDYLWFEEYDRYGITERVTFTDGEGQVKERFYRGGRIANIERTKRGELDGLQEQYYPDGTPQSRVEYSSGERDGVFEKYHPNGRLWVRGTFKDGKREGAHEVWSKDGTLDKRTVYKNDEAIEDRSSDAILFRKAFDSANEELEGEQVSVDNPDLLKEYNLSNVTMTKKGDLVTLNKVVVAEQKQGNGTRFMEDLTTEADNNGWTLALTPDKSFGATSVKRLKDFYKRFGFKENKGRNADLTVNESMIRQPEEVRFRKNGSAPENEGIYKGQPFWCGSVSLIDGYIEEVHTFEEAEDSDFHHSFYFSPAQAEKITNEENAFFWIEDGKIEYEWRTTVPQNILEEIKRQIKLRNSEEVRFRITPEQDERYMSAVESGDMETAQRMVDEAAEAAGYTIRGYHQTNSKRYVNKETGQDWDTLDWNEKEKWEHRDDWDEHWEERDFYTFDRRNARTSIEMPAYFFAPEEDPYHEYGDRTIDAYLKLTNPVINPEIENAGVTNDAGERAMRKYIEEGYDGFIREENGQAYEYGVFDSSQIKSADPVTYDDNGDVIPLSERFNEGNDDIRFRKVKPIIDGRSDALFDAAKKRFGTTRKLSEAGYALPDGSMLDFSGRHLLGEGQDGSWLNDQRTIDHREISDLNYEEDLNTPSGIETDMSDFIRRGAIRLNSGVINLAAKPTPKQENVLWSLIEKAGGNVDVDFGDGWDSDHYVSYDNARPARVINDIRRYFDEGINPEGNVMFRKGEAKTEDGETINYESTGGLPDGSRRTSLVERTYRKTGAFSFTGKDKIESAADVAYIFKELETSATENSFIVFVKDGKPTILHTGIGTINKTEIDSAPMVVGLKDFAPDEVYMVHNHPSGRVEASQADWKELERLQKIAGDIPVQGVIIDTVTGEYGMFDADFGGTLVTSDARGHEDDNTPLEVLTFDKMVFSPEYREEIRGARMTSPQNVAAYISAHRLGEGSKIGALLVDRKGMVTGNLVFNGNHIDKDNARDFASDAADAAIRSGAEQVILFGDFDYSRGPLSDFRQALTDLSGGNVRLTDVVKVDGNHTRSLAEGTLMDEGDFWADQHTEQEKRAIGEKPVVNVVVDTTKVKLPTTRTEAIDIVDKMPKPFTNDDQGKEFVLSHGDIKHIATQDNSHQKIDLKCLGVVDQIIKNAVKIGNDQVSPDEVGHTHSVEIYYCPVKIDSVQYSARLVVKEYENRGMVLDDLHLYDLAAKERKPVAVSRGTGTKALTPTSASGSGYKVKDLIHSTKINDQKLLGLSSGFLFDSASETDEYGDAEVRFRKVTDQSTLDRLNSEPTIKVYRAMQEIDGKLYPPMAAKVEGRMQEPIEIGVWEEAVERPELADAKGNFTLNKGNGKSLKARYNPYIHTSRSPLNDQFTSAYDRPNLVTVEVEVPESELTSGYKAEKAKDSVGEMAWHSGPVSGKLPKEKSRKVILTRWDKPVRIVPDSEVAERIAELLEGENIAVPYNVITPSLREALIEKGVEISGQPSGTVREDAGQIRFRKSQDLVRQSRESGLAGIIGDEDATELYRNVYRAVPREIRERITDKAGDSYIFSGATEDIISEAVEKGDKTGIAGLAANMLRDYVGDLDERTARYILWRGTRKEADDDLIDTVKDIAMRRRLKVGEFADPVMFRLADDIEEAQNRADSMADDAKATLDEKKSDAKDNDALTTIKAMSLQKEYDRKTVNTITVLAKNIIKDQNVDTLNRREISRLLGIISTSVGKAPKTVKQNADALVGLIVDHLLRSEETKLGMLTSRRASKTNTAGVEVQGELDVRGQNVLKAYKAGLDMNVDNPEDESDTNTINARLSALEEKLYSEDDAERSAAEDEYAGLTLAKEYQEKIKASANEDRGIRNEMREAAEAYRAGQMSGVAYRQFVEESERSLRENKIERVEAYRDLAAKMREMMSGSVEARKAFTERDKERVDEIHHLANSDMQGRTASPFKESTWTGRLANSSIVRFFAKPLATFDQMLRLFGEKNVAGEGYLWNKFHRGWLESAEKAYLGEKEAKDELDAKVSEVFDRKMRWSDLYAEERKMPTVKVKWWDDGGMKEHELTQGNLLYIYMVNKMTDGRMKLRRMGITQETVDAIARQMDERFIELADWLQDEYLVQKRNKYNAVHERLFGASMAAIGDYFPLKINKRSLNRAEDIGRPEFDDALPATTTGSIIKRKRNAQDLDLPGADAFSVVIEHIEQMEQWAAFAEFNRDLNTLLSYKRFRNQVQNMASVYGSGPELWRNFKSVCRIAGGTYNPAGKKSDLDTAALNIAKGVTAAKISFRVYTALKQLLSAPAFVADADFKYLAANVATPWKAWNWAMENLPVFQKRWKSRMAGDTRLMKTDSDWKFFQSQLYDTLSRLGMSPNAFVDALTVSIGSHSIYQTRYERYIKDGYTEEQADKRAKQDATTLYNETQQSNESAFVAPVQLDRTVLSTMLTVFRNSAMGYQRQLHDAIRNIGKMMRPGYKAASVEFMTKQMVRDGLTEEQAAHAANRNYNREIWRSAARIATFGFLVEFAWNLGGSIAYLLFGDDDDEKQEMLKEAAIHGLIGGSMEGLAGGNVMSEALNMVAKGESLNNYDPSLLPIVSDIKSTYKKMSYDPVAGSNDLVNLAIQAGLGVNPQTLTDAVVAVVDACGGDLGTSKEAMLLIMRVLQVPQSQVDKIYIDELGMTAKKARSLGYEEMAERYARYKINKGAPITGWAYSDEAEEKREKSYLKSFKKKVKEREKLHEK